MAMLHRSISKLNTLFRSASLTFFPLFFIFIFVFLQLLR